MKQMVIVTVFAVLSGVSQAGETKPTRELGVQTLLDFHRCLEQKDFKKALTYLKFPKDISGKEPEIIKGLAKLVGSSEISKKGIQILGRKGKWDSLAKLQSKKEAKRMSWGLAPKRCFGLFASPRNGAAFYWDGSRLLITYFNNIASLENE